MTRRAPRLLGASLQRPRNWSRSYVRRSSPIRCAASSRQGVYSYLMLSSRKLMRIKPILIGKNSPEHPIGHRTDGTPIPRTLPKAKQSAWEQRSLVQKLVLHPSPYIHRHKQAQVHRQPVRCLYYDVALSTAYEVTDKTPSGYFVIATT